MIIALGKGDTDEYRDNLHKVDIIFQSYLNISSLFYKKKKCLLTVIFFIVSRSASNYEEKWEFFSQIKQKMKYKSKYPLPTLLTLQ